MSQSFTTDGADKPFAEYLLDAIDTVHDVSGITGLRIECASLPHGWRGQFDPYTRIITVSPAAPFPLSTGAHEIGHALDAIFLVVASKLGRLDSPITLYASQYATDERGVLVDWFQVAIQSRPIVDLKRIRQSLPFMSVEWRDAVYLLDPTEIWARAYEQFIGINTRDTDLQDQFRDRREEETPIGDRKIGVYWTQEEFQPIEREIKRVLETLGWI